jgi:hypothetical protein
MPTHALPTACTPLFLFFYYFLGGILACCYMPVQNFLNVFLVLHPTLSSRLQVFENLFLCSSFFSSTGWTRVIIEIDCSG